jgi:hypothetical protein
MDPHHLAEEARVVEGVLEEEVAAVQAAMAREAKEAWVREEEMEVEVRVAQEARAEAVQEEAAREDL